MSAGRTSYSRGGLLLGGGLVVLGGILRKSDSLAGGVADARFPDGSRFWLAFLIGGLLIGLLAMIFSLFNRVARLVAIGVLAVLVVLFVLEVRSSAVESSGLLGFAFVGGGLLVATAVMFADTIGGHD